MADLVSIIIPTYNSASFIEETLRSVLDQDYPNMELIVVDDCSNDDTVARVDAMNDPRIRVLAQTENGGAGVARNIGVEAAQGRYIAFLDSDDYWFEGKLSGQIAFMKSGGIASCYTRYSLIGDDGETFGDSGELPSSLTFKQLLPHNIIRTSSYVFDVGNLGKLYFPTIRIRQDFGLFLNATKQAGQSYLYDVETCAYRVRSDSLSGKKLRNVPYQWAFYVESMKLGRLHAARLLAQWFFNAGSVWVRRRMMRLSH